MEQATRKIMLKLFLIVIMIAVFAILFFVGIAIGFSVVGEGHLGDAFNSQVWEHIMRFVK